MKKANKKTGIFSRIFSSSTTGEFSSKPVSLDQKRADLSRLITKDMSKLFVKLGER